MWHSCDNISGNKLQQKVIEIADAINVKIEPSEIEAYHRLPKGDKDKNAKTIVRFVIRKMCDTCLLYTSPSPRDGLLSRMPSSA